jgi:hypothetical protein
MTEFVFAITVIRGRGWIYAGVFLVRSSLIPRLSIGIVVLIGGGERVTR